MTYFSGQQGATPLKVPYKPAKFQKNRNFRITEVSKKLIPTSISCSIVIKNQFQKKGVGNPPKRITLQFSEFKRVTTEM